jgi:hypothetical protein
LACHQAVAKQDLGHKRRLNTSPCYCGLNGSTAEVMGGEAGEVALKTSHRGARSADNHNGVVHGNGFQ